MATINQIRANRRNAQKSTGPKSPAGKERVRFNALVHGLRAESTVIPGEDRAKFDQLLERLSAAWIPQDDMEKTLIEQIAVNQWKLSRLDQSEARFYEPGAMTPVEFALAIHRIHLTEARLERSVSSAIADMERYRKERIERKSEITPKRDETYRIGLIWKSSEEDPGTYTVLPQVRGLDGVWREIPRELLGDPAPPVTPEANGPA